jgi:phosphoglycolate phosphatase
MGRAFAGAGLPAPSDVDVRSIVGLSLPQAMETLCPGGPNAELVDGYKAAYFALNQQTPPLSLMFPGIMQVLDMLHAQDEVILGIATGKSRRGLEAMITRHGLERFFLTVQVADDHPSKPHPSMIWTAMQEIGVEAENTMIIGDTSFDMEMGRVANVRRLGVAWGYHPVEALFSAGAQAVAQQVSELPQMIEQLWGIA